MRRLLASLYRFCAGIVRDIVRGMRVQHYLRTHRTTGCTAFMTDLVAHGREAHRDDENR